MGCEGREDAIWFCALPWRHCSPQQSPSFVLWTFSLRFVRWAHSVEQAFGELYWVLSLCSSHWSSLTPQGPTSSSLACLSPHLLRLHGHFLKSRAGWLWERERKKEAMRASEPNPRVGLKPLLLWVLFLWNSLYASTQGEKTLSSISIIFKRTCLFI